MTGNDAIADDRQPAPARSIAVPPTEVQIYLALGWSLVFDGWPFGEDVPLAPPEAC
jgi:hypothetical protein